MKAHGITLEVSLGFILRLPKEVSTSMEIPSNITIQLHCYLEVLQRVILLILLVNLFRCCEIDNNDMIRKEKEKAKAKEKEKEKGRRKSKNTELEGDNCFNLSLLADLRYVITNIIEIICYNVQSYHSVYMTALLCRCMRSNSVLMTSGGPFCCPKKVIQKISTVFFFG